MLSVYGIPEYILDGVKTPFTEYTADRTQLGRWLTLLGSCQRETGYREKCGFL